MSLTLSTVSVGVPDAFATEIAPRILAERAHMRAEILRGYESAYASLLLPRETRFAAESLTLAREFADVSSIVIVGIGGSNLGTLAVFQALSGMYPTRRVYFLDTVDGDHTEQVLGALSDDIARGGHVLSIAISKSGTTTETVVLLEVLLTFLRSQDPDYDTRVVTITDRDSPLYHLARERGFRMLDIPREVGGRYSVFSSVGLFPLACLGVDIEALLAGAEQAVEDHISRDHAPAFESALAMYYAYRVRGIRVVDHFLFANRLEGLGKWYRQLLGESIGKMPRDADANTEPVGITPTVSIGSTDLHSVGQLYIANPGKTLFCLVRTAEESGIVLGRDTESTHILPMLSGKRFGMVMRAIYEGVVGTFRAKHIPFMEVTFPEVDAWHVGYFLQMKMCEVIMLASLLDVNPFDQPNVEEYKHITRSILEEEWRYVPTK